MTKNKNEVGGILMVPIKDIELTGWNPRKKPNAKAIKELAVSILAVGLLQPLVVREHPTKKGKYQLIAGERRLTAAKEAKLKYIQVQVLKLDDRRAREVMLIENLQREDLNPIEEAKALKALLEDGITQTDLAKQIGKSQPWVAASNEEHPKLASSAQVRKLRAMIVCEGVKYGPHRDRLLEDRRVMTNRYLELHLKSELTKDGVKLDEDLHKFTMQQASDLIDDLKAIKPRSG